jgi:hypothetical protein
MPRGLASEGAQLIIVTGLCLVGAYIMWWAIERPAHELAKRIGAKR